MKYENLTSDRYYHIYNRGNNNENLFKENKNYIFFLNLMKKHLVEVTEILSYCLLKNHLHLLIKTKENCDDQKISQKFSNFFNSYSKSINKAYNRNGSLFQDRFSRKKIDTESYLRELIIYIHLNPTHHGFTNDFSTYSHSSFESLISTKKTLLARKFVLELFRDKENFKYVHYAKTPELNKEITLE